ncbi:MAG: hypothetical protein ACKVOW_00600 [Chitinophagaceae bacterium]
MKKQPGMLLIMLMIVIGASAQKTKKSEQFADLSVGFGSSSQGSISAGYFYNWKFGKRNKLFIGTGARFNVYYGKKINFLSAPANLAAEESKTDTLLGANPGIYSMNALINLGYNFSSKLQAGFNIDVVGFSFGPEGSPTFIGNGSTINTKAKPTGFNLLLVGNNDRGSINSEFYIRYKINSHIGVKAAYEYFFTELTTTSKVQTVPEKNDRFRNKASLFNIGISYHF